MITKTRQFWSKRHGGDAYLSLIRQFPLRTVRTAAQHDEAMALVCRLAAVDEGTLSEGEQEYLDALTVLLEDYDRQQEPWRRVSGLELLKHLMQEAGMNVTDLGKIVGSRPLASLILSSKRELSKEAVKRLGRHFHLDAGAFL